VVLGDFNFDPTSVEYQTTVGAGRSPFIDVWLRVGLGSGATKDGGRIDQGWVTVDLAPRLRAAWVDGDAVGSDHQPVWFDIDV
jgi:endonuclease/exonuclease/phosphatase family metal-dependent hydrolase